MKSVNVCSDRKKVREFIKRLNPYSMPKPLNVDLRMFLEYVDTHEIDKSTITEELVQKFSR